MNKKEPWISPNGVDKSREIEQQECLHTLCPDCEGGGVKKKDGTSCVHMISCSCEKCSPRY